MTNGQSTVASLVIPAHNESAVIGRLLDGIAASVACGDVEAVVICNGCTDDTAAIARSYAGVDVVESPVPSKAKALRLGDSKATAFPRLYVDADIEMGERDVRTLAAALTRGDVIAAAPMRTLDLSRSSRIVRSYYAVWQALPQVRSGLFGRGVIAVSQAGQQRLAALPDAMSDDLAASEAFAGHERAVVDDARAIVRAPRSTRDLLRRRVRVHMGNAELDDRSGRSAESQTSVRALLALMREQPRLIVHMPVFVGIAVVAKIIARRNMSRGDSTWNRDESSRQ